MELDIDRLSGSKIMVATPMYGGQCAGRFCKSISDLSRLAARSDIEVKLFFMLSESLITRARNYCCDEFLRSDCSHLMFIDADISFGAKDVLTLLSIMLESPEIDVLGGPYPKKHIAWDKIKLASDSGIADEDPRMLENFAGDFVLNAVAGQNEISLSEPCEIGALGTGFMMLNRDVLERFKTAYPERSFLPDSADNADFDGSRPVHAFFDTLIDPDTRRYLSEDYMFCQYVRRMGGKIYLCPWMELMHIGSYTYRGSLGSLAEIGAAATN